MEVGLLVECIGGELFFFYFQGFLGILGDSWGFFYAVVDLGELQVDRISKNPEESLKISKHP